jgi:hypothetical protein
MPHSEFEKDGKLKIVIAGLDQNVRNQAVVAANERLNAETNERGFKGFIRGRVWKGNMARERYLEKYRQEAEAEIRENDNLLQHEDRSDEAARVATTLRYASEFEDEVIHEGETRKNIESDDSPEAQEIKAVSKDLIKLYATGQLDDDSFEEEKRRKMTELAEKGVSQKYIGEGMMYADNLLQISQNVKAAIDHGKSVEELDEMLENAEFVVGEARMGARTEARLSGTERIMKKLEGKAFVHEATVATAVSIAYSIGGWAAKTAVGAVGKLAIPGIGAGAIAVLRENRVLKEERALHMREMAEGKKFADTRQEQPNAYDLLGEALDLPATKRDTRREKLEESRYETKSAKDLTDQLSVLYDDEGKLRVEGDKTRFDEAMAIVAEIQARIRISDRDKLDLIGFSGVENIETERLNLDLALAKAKVDLRHMINDADDPTLTALGIQPADVNRLKADGEDVIPFVLDSKVEATEGVLGGEMKERDRVFNKFRRQRLAGAFVKGTVLGVTFGLGAQELMALGSDSTEGLLEQVFEGGQQGATHETFLASAFGGGEHAQALSGLHGAPIELSDGSKLTLPAEFQPPQIIDGKLNIMGADGSSMPNLQNLQLNPDGTLSSQAMDALKASGFNLTSTHDVISHSVSSQETVSAEQFHQAHQDLATHVTRDFWYDNGTPRVFEGRELQLDLHYDTDGNIVFDASRMHLSPEQLQHVQMAVSETGKQQHDPFMFKFNDHSQAVVNKDLQGMFHKGPDGQPVFDGKYAEASEVAGVDGHGVTHIRPLATVVGEGHSSFTDTVTHTETQPVTSYVVDYNPPTPETVVDVPPVIPIYGRRGLGEVTNPAEPEPESPPPPERLQIEGAPQRPQIEGAPDRLQIQNPPDNDNPDTTNPPLLTTTPDRNLIGGVPGTSPEEDQGSPFVPDNRQLESSQGTSTRPNTETDSTQNGSETPLLPGEGPAEPSTEQPAQQFTPPGTPPRPEPEFNPGTPPLSPEDRVYVDALDAEALDTPFGYDFPGYVKVGSRERKQAMRFLKQATDELGGDDKVAVVIRAQELAQEALNAASDQMKPLYEESVDVLRRSAERVERDAEKVASGGRRYLDDLDSESGDFPFKFTLRPGGYSPEAQKLVARIFREVRTGLQEEVGPAPDEKADPNGYNAWYNKLFRRAQGLVHPDQYTDLSDEQRAVFYDAQAAFSQARGSYRAKTSANR